MPLPRSRLILLQNQGVPSIFRKTATVPKSLEKTSKIPKNRTGSGRSKKDPERDEIRLEVRFFHEEGREGRRDEKLWDK